MHREMCWAPLWAIAQACESIIDPFSSFSPLWSPSPSFKWLIPFLPLMKGTLMCTHTESTHTYMRNTRETHTRSCHCVPLQRPLPSCCHVSARALATASERANKKERSWREQGRGEWVKRGREKEMGGSGSRRALISDESNSVNCC